MIRHVLNGHCDTKSLLKWRSRDPVATRARHGTFTIE
jgi:hypothetical protein